LKTQPKQLLGYLALDFELSGQPLQKLASLSHFSMFGSISFLAKSAAIFCGQFYEQFTSVTYGRGNLSYYIFYNNALRYSKMRGKINAF
jgi:hypothetical protein